MLLHEFLSRMDTIKAIREESRKRTPARIFTSQNLSSKDPKHKNVLSRPSYFNTDTKAEEPKIIQQTPEILPKHTRAASAESFRTRSGAIRQQSTYNLSEYQKSRTSLSTNESRFNSTPIRFTRTMKSLTQRSSQETDRFTPMNIQEQQITNPTEGEDPNNKNIQTSFANCPVITEHNVSSLIEYTSRTGHVMSSRNISAMNIPTEMQEKLASFPRIPSAKDVPVVKEVSRPSTKRTQSRSSERKTPVQIIKVKRTAWDSIIHQKVSYEQKHLPPHVVNALEKINKVEEEKINKVEEAKVKSSSKRTQSQGKATPIPQAVNTDYGGIHRVWSYRLFKPGTGEFRSSSQKRASSQTPEYLQRNTFNERIESWQSKLKRKTDTNSLNSSSVAEVETDRVSYYFSSGLKNCTEDAKQRVSSDESVFSPKRVRFDPIAN